METSSMGVYEGMETEAATSEQSNSKELAVNQLTEES